MVRRGDANWDDPQTKTRVTVIVPVERHRDPSCFSDAWRIKYSGGIPTWQFTA